MTTDIASLGIRIDASQVSQANRELDKMTASAARTERAIDAMQSQINSILAPLRLMQGLLGGLTAALGIRELVRYADTWALIEARLKLVTTSTQQLIAVQQRLFEIAQSTRSSYEATADLFTRVARNASNLGKSQGELLKFTQALQQALQISGASAAEASSVITQLGQALGSGTLRGDEFTRLAESGGAAMDFLAKALNTTIGGLRKMAEAGKLTSELVIDSMNKMAPEIGRQYAQIPTTVSAAFVLLQNSIQKFVGETSKSSGASRELASAVTFLANNLEDVASAVINVGAAIATVLIARAISPAIAATAAWARQNIELGTALARAKMGNDEYGASLINGTAAVRGRAAAELQSAQAAQVAAAQRVNNIKLTQAEVAANLERIAKEKALALAQLETARGIEIATGRTQVVTKAQLEHNEALKAQLAHQQLQRSLSGQLVAAKEAEAVASARAAAAETAHAAAIRATSIGARAATAAMAAWNQVLAFFGGPIGLAITAVTGAYLLLSSRQDAATKLTERYSQQLDEQAKAAKRATIDVNALSEAERKRAQIGNQAQAIDLEKQVQDARRALTIARGAEAGSAFGFLLNSGSMSAYSDATKAFKGFNDTGNLDAFRDALVAIGEKQKSLIPMVEEYLKKIDALKLAEKELADLRGATGKDVLDNLTAEDRERAKIKQTIEQLKDVTKELYGDQEKTNTQIALLQRVVDAGADALGRYGMSAEAARMGIAALQESISPVAAAIGDLNRQADLLGKSDGYERNLAKLMQDAEQKTKRPLNESEVTGLTQSFQRERAAAMQDYISSLDDRIAAEKRLAAATASGNETAAARARVEVQLIDLAKQYGPEFDKNATRTKLLQIEMAKLGGSTANATAEMRLQTEATIRLADAAGKGEAAIRAANRENEIAAAARKSAAEGARLRTELEAREAQEVIKIRSEQNASIQEQIRQQQALAAVIGRGQAAVQAVTINEKARALALREAQEGTEAYTAALIEYTAQLTKAQQLENSNALRGQIANREDQLKLIEAQVSGLQLEDGARAQMLQHLQDEIELKKLGIDINGQMTDEQRKLADEYLKSGDRLVKANQKLEEQNKQIEGQKQIWTNMVKGIQDAFAGFFENVLSNGKLTWSSLADSLKKVMISTISQIAAAMVFKPVIGEVLNGVGLGGVAKAAGLGSGTGAGGSGGGFSLSDLFGGGTPGGGSMFSGASNWLFGSAASGNINNPASFVPGSSGVLGSGGNVLGIDGFSPGTAFAGIGTALSAFNFIKNPSVGSGVGLVGSGLGLASALGAIGPAFGPVGMALSVAAPLLGSLFGGNKVKHPGMGIEIMNGAEGLSLGKVSGKHMDTSGATPMGQAAIDTINAAVKSLTGGTVGAGTGGQVYGLSYDGTVKKYRAVGEGLSESTQYESIGDAIKAVTVSALKNLPLDGVADNIATALKNSTADSLEGIKADIDFAKGFKDQIALMNAGLDPLKSQAAEISKNAKDAAAQWENFGVTFRQRAIDLGQGSKEEVNAALQRMMDGALGLVKASEPLTGYALAYEQAKANIAALKDVLVEFGLTAEEAGAKIAEATEAARKNLASQQVKDLQSELTSLTNPMQGALDALKKWREEQIAQANALNNNEALSLIEKLFGAKQQEILKQYNQSTEQLAAAQKEAAKAAADLAKAVQDMADQMATRSLTALQRTREAALLTYDIQARNERASAPAGTNMNWLGALQGAERASINFEQTRNDFYEALDRQARDIQDQIDALGDQRSSIESQISAIDEQTAALKQTRDAMKDLVKSLKDYKESLLVSDLAPGTREDRLREAERQMRETFAKAMSGDQAAASEFQGRSRTFLEASRDYYASTKPYADAFSGVQSMLDQLISKFGGDVQTAQLDEMIKQGETLKAQLTVLNDQEKALNDQLKAIEDQREWASRLNERVVGSVDELRAELIGAAGEQRAAQDVLSQVLAQAMAGVQSGLNNVATAISGISQSTSTGTAANNNVDLSNLMGSTEYQRAYSALYRLAGQSEKAVMTNGTGVDIEAAGFSDFNQYNQAIDGANNAVVDYLKKNNLTLDQGIIKAGVAAGLDKSKILTAPAMAGYTDAVASGLSSVATTQQASIIAANDNAASIVNAISGLGGITQASGAASAEAFKAWTVPTLRGAMVRNAGDEALVARFGITKPSANSNAPAAGGSVSAPSVSDIAGSLSEEAKARLIREYTDPMRRELEGYGPRDQQYQGNQALWAELERDPVGFALKQAAGYTEFHNPYEYKKRGEGAALIDVVNTYNQGGSYNDRSLITGTPEWMKAQGFPGYEEGGVVANGTPGRDSVIAILAGGEGVVRTGSMNQQTRPMVQYMNATGRVPERDSAEIREQNALLKRQNALLEQLVEVSAAGSGVVAEAVGELTGAVERTGKKTARIQARPAPSAA